MSSAVQLSWRHFASHVSALAVCRTGTRVQPSFLQQRDNQSTDARSYDKPNQENQCQTRLDPGRQPPPPLSAIICLAPDRDCTQNRDFQRLHDVGSHAESSFGGLSCPSHDLRIETRATANGKIPLRAATIEPPDIDRAGTASDYDLSASDRIARQTKVAGKQIARSARKREASTYWGSFSTTNACNGVLVCDRRTMHFSRDGASKMVR